MDNTQLKPAQPWARLTSGHAVFIAILLAWLAIVAYAAVAAAHPIPDYGDLTRWILDFIMPLAQSDQPRIVAALFSEYEFPGHGHVLTKAVILAISQYFHFDFHVMRVIGVCAYSILLMLLLYWAARDMTRQDDKVYWWQLTLLLILLVHPEERYSTTNNLLSFEYLFFLMAWLLVIAVYRFLLEGRGLLAVGLLLPVVAVLGDIAFALALFAVYGLVFVSWLAGQRRIVELLPLLALVIGVPVLLYLAGVEATDGSGKGDFSAPGLIKWLAAGLGGGLVGAGWLRGLGLSTAVAYQWQLLLGGVVLGGIVIAAVDTLLRRRPINLGMALMIFGTLAVVGSYVTRHNLGEHYVMGERYVRYASFAVTGLVWHGLCLYRAANRSASQGTQWRYLAASVLGVLLLVFTVQVAGYFTAIKSFANHYRVKEQQMRSYSEGERQPELKFRPLMPAVIKRKPELARAPLKFYFECRQTPASCKIL